ncbi:hypothetical protein EMCG_00036 [[Emmonsia] crescens]|uniref:Chromatin assembly factor 1 subunit A n=1 Tax=[Emmonsia] crescens TaxID=73230 RepID=A0A0G2IEN6_9EURO|nr:hypothetical protein EMCG_00036 [Emmonsia crescens UAMH 3008]
MGGEPLLGSTSTSTLSRKRSFSEVDGCVQTVNTENNDRIIVSDAVVPNVCVVQESTTTTSSERKPEIHPSIETTDIPLSTTRTTTSVSVDPPPSANTNVSPDPSILMPIPLPNNDINIHNQNQTPPPPTSPSAPGFTLPNNNKKRKLSPASKQVRALEKEMKEKQRAEEKAKRDVERKKKEEERKKREEERKKKDEEREEERKKREEKKKAKDEERMKKEKVRQEFPPFFLQSHVKLAPPHRFERDINSLKYAREKLDSVFKKNRSSEEEGPVLKFRPSELFDMLPYRRRQGKPNGPTMKEIILRMQDAASNTIDLTGDEKTENPGNFLKKIPMKVLKFSEDVRPPYQGTFTNRLPEQQARRLCRNPFGRMVPNFNYDYDSEAEWEEPEEGEDLDSEGEEETSEDGDGEMEDFLDDGDDNAVAGRRRVLIGDLEPVCSGICWEGEGEIDPTLNSCRMEIISETLNFPIDPFSSVYWSKPTQVSRSPLKHLTHLSNQSLERAGAITNPSQKQISQSSGLLQPPSSTLPSSTLTTTLPSGQSTLLPGAPSTQKPRRPFPPDQVAEFKQVIAGSNLTKAGLIEVLKKRFPKVSKDIIKDTLNSTAQRLGQKEADKKWVLI